MVVAPASGAPQPHETLLILSDVHLGSDLNDRAPPGGAPRRSKRIDEDLIALFRHYTARADLADPAKDRWRAVIAGDFIDFIGMAIATEGARQSLNTAPDEEELAHGLGNASDHAREKLLRVAVRHREVLASIADFVARGHALTMVHGNHDIEFHWEAVRTEFKAILLQLAKESHPDVGLDEGAFLARIEFNPWFFWKDGVAYIEHGHQYDAMCATDFVMAPLSPLDPRRIARGFTEIFLRYVVRPTRGMKEHGHESKGLVDYIAFAIGLGVRGLWNLAVRFASAVLELFRLRRAYFTDAANKLREEHERRMGLLAEATRIGIDRLRALAALQVPPVTRSIRGILASVLLDRLALALLTAMMLVGVAIASWNHGHLWWAAGLVVAAWALANRHLSSQRKLEPDDLLVDRAAHLAKLFPAAFVVMGHTHVPQRVPVGDGTSTYINVGSWAEEEEDPLASSSYRAARTHLVIRTGESGPVAEFLAWDPAAGPRAYTLPPAKSPL
jgi:UDP-2,3-diacylglucosamine pyrophosphatase LpxH